MTIRALPSGQSPEEVEEDVSGSEDGYDQTNFE